MIRRLQFSLRTLLLFIVLSALPLVCWTYEPYRLARQLRNTDIRWDGNYFGLMPECRGRPACALIETGRRATPALVQALGDRRKFAAAHVILTRLWEDSFQFSAADWNGLRIDLYGDGSTTVYDEQIPELRSYWDSKLGRVPSFKNHAPPPR